jgi:hypothetical protein
MSNMFGSAKPQDEARALPQGETVGSYVSYLDAQKAVDYLADQQFPVELVAIVGNDLKLVERVTGRLTYPRVALNGALSGMWFGLFVGVLLSFFTPNGSYFSIITSVLMGAAFFMLFGIVTYAMQRGKRDFTSTSQVVASNYDVVVGREVAHDARRLLAQLPMGSGNVPQGWNQQGWNQQGWQHDQHPQDQHQQDQHGWNQPGQQQGWKQPQSWQPPQEPEPKRPSGWTDPYGVTTGEQGHPQPQPEHPAAPQETPAAPSSRYPDLPDGRPQYGVRVDREHPDAQRRPEEADAGDERPDGAGDEHPEKQ